MTDPGLWLADVLTAAELGRVLGIDPAVLRTDTPLADVGADPIAIVLWADAVEAALAVPGRTPLQLDDAKLSEARVVGDLTAAVSATMAQSGGAPGSGPSTVEVA